MSKEVHVLFKFANNPYGGIEIDTTSGNGKYRELSPFVLGPIDTYVKNLFTGKPIQAQNFENLWQYSKVYRNHTEPVHDNPITLWHNWRDEGWKNPKAVRYPMGKGIKPLYSYWNGEKLGYVEARKKIYATIYAKYVIKTDAFKELEELYNNMLHRERCGDEENIVLRDYDAYDHVKEGISLKEVINNPNKKCGHAFVLAMILQGELEECIK